MAEEKRTQFAMQALGFADLFNIKIGDQKVLGPITYRIELSAPEGPSTGGGKQAVQHIKLIPEDGQGAVIVAGSANQLEKLAEIRTYEYLADMHSQRFKGARIPLDKVQYGELVRRMQVFFAEQGLRLVMLDAPRPVAGQSAAARGPAPTGFSPMTMVAVFVIVAAVIAGALFFVLRSRGG